MNIGQAASASGVSAKMIRYHEAIRLIPPAARSASGYLEYVGNDVHRPRLTRRARDLGFSVTDIGALLGWRNDRARRSADVKRLAEAHIVELEDSIGLLREMADSLQALIDCCAGDERPDRPILAKLDDPDAQQKL